MSISLNVKKLDKKIDKLQRQRNNLIVERIAKCSHPKNHVYEHRLIDSPPDRVCTKCGLSEQGWGCGYLLLEGYESDGIRKCSFEKYLDNRLIRFDQENLNNIRDGARKGKLVNVCYPLKKVKKAM